MKKLRFTADITFLAEGLDDAFDLLQTHFGALLAGEDSTFEFQGKMNIWRLTEEEEGEKKDG